MNYRHHYHAGNFADVIKHALLIRLMRLLQQKERGFLCLDTHAGRGTYDLTEAATGDTHARAPEWPDGIGRVWAHDATGAEARPLPAGLADYVELVRGYDRSQGNRGATPKFYPGSPMLMSLLARAQERLVFCERQPDEVKPLRDRFQFSDGVQVRETDGYGAVRALLPPLEKRALVLIDPPFEAQDEWAQIVEAVRDGLRRLPGGVFAIWYPLTERAKVDRFFAELGRLELPPTLAVELDVDPPMAKMKGCGLVVVNPPWKFAEEAETIVKFLGQTLAQGPGARGDLIWLVREK